MAHSEETKAKLRAAWVERRKSFVPPMKGKKMSAESRQKMRDAWAERKADGNTPVNSHRIGATHSTETRALISQRARERAVRGEACHSFKDGRVAERRGERFGAPYKRWRYDVFIRDGFTCQRCGDSRGGNLRAHHVREFADYPSLRLTTHNGLTLCNECHDGLHRGNWQLALAVRP